MNMNPSSSATAADHHHHHHPHSGSSNHNKQRQLHALLRKRDDHREQLTRLWRRHKSLQEQMQAVESAKSDLEAALMEMDDEIDRLEEEQLQELEQEEDEEEKEVNNNGHSIIVGNGEREGSNSLPVVSEHERGTNRPFHDENDDQYAYHEDNEEAEENDDEWRHIESQYKMQAPPVFTKTQPDEIVEDPLTMTQLSPAPLEHQRHLSSSSHHRQIPMGISMGQLDLVTAAKPQTIRISTTPLAITDPSAAQSRPTVSVTLNSSSIDTRLSNSSSHVVDLITPRNGSTPAAASASGPSFNPSNQPSSLTMTHHTADDPNAFFRNDANFPWSGRVQQILQSTFQLSTFRDQQKEIIHATVSGKDVFVVMRTGGGKSLTYQLPALLEGRYGNPPHKVTFVVSPLLSLIQDQEEHMNGFVPGSAVSFSSSIGSAEHARRWNLVRDPSAGVCLVFVTPEKISQSKKLQTEMEKLSVQGRLGRFVIDEAHCASQWGHDFRPDYTQLGVLKRHFPAVPCLAVTATASDKVRLDVCDILCIGRNYCFFRSTANRPNLHYSVRPKGDGKDLVQDMVLFIKEHHARHAGIVYTFSRKDADTVASQLCDYGVVAYAYHSDVSATNKERIHKTWMRGDTQVVVATIAFGLGINKPDVRFVLHHSLSKTLDAYYQESGRAGRDGQPAECILYYSPKDVMRMLKMVHGTKGEKLLWSMVRYANASGNDAVCRAILMSHLGEPIVNDIEALMGQYDGTVTDRRDVGRHCQTVTKLLAHKLDQHEKVTMPMLLKEWRTKSKNSPSCVLDFPPSTDNLTVEDCERIIISLLLESVLEPKIVWSAYDSIVYLVLGKRGEDLIRSSQPLILIRFPITTNDPKPSAKEAKKRCRITITDDDGWVATKGKKTSAVTKKKAAGSKVKTGKKTKTASKKRVQTKLAKSSGKLAFKRSNNHPTEVIDILSSDDEEDTDEEPPNANDRHDVAAMPRRRTQAQMFDSTSEEEFDDDE